MVDGAKRKKKDKDACEVCGLHRWVNHLLRRESWEEQAAAFYGGAGVPIWLAHCLLDSPGEMVLGVGTRSVGERPGQGVPVPKIVSDAARSGEIAQGVGGGAEGGK